MPLLFFAARYVVVAVFLWGADFLATKVGLPLINNAISETMQLFGVSEETAEDIMANEFILQLERLGIFALAARSRVPLVIADRLKFTAKGWKMRNVSATTKAKVEASQKPSGPTLGKVGGFDKNGKWIPGAGTPASIPATIAELDMLAKARTGKLLAAAGTLGTILKWLAGAYSLALLTLYVLSNVIDFAAWTGSAYQKTFQALLAIIGLEPDTRLKKASTISDDMWKKVFATMKSVGAVGITDPDAKTDYTLTAQNLALVTDKIVGPLLAAGEDVKVKDVIALLMAHMIFLPGAQANEGGLGFFPPSTGGTGVAVLPTRTATQIQIYTGVLTSGALGTPAEFIARPDDMIEDMDELKAAAKNNLASFVQSLPGKFYYELAIVNTVKSRGGFTQKGSPVRIISSYNKNGTPRYKTIYHKFAVMQLGVLDENGRSVKLGKINLGPVNAVSFQPTTTQLQDVAKLITPELFTSDISSVSSIITSSPVSVSSATPQNPNPPTQTPAPEQTLAIAPVPAPAPLPVAVRVYSAAELKMRAATNLSEFYIAIGSTLPPLYMRAKYYAAAGLGAESTYVGSAEQNGRFLAWLKSSNGV